MRSIRALALLALLPACSGVVDSGGRQESVVAVTGGYCIDGDGDGYGLDCAKGFDCDDTDPNVNEICSPTAFAPVEEVDGGTAPQPDLGEQACVAGAVRTCQTGCGSVGTATCDMAGKWENCIPPTSEASCNDGVDDDCDGKVDVADGDCGAQCQIGAAKDCATTCGSVGAARCDSSGQWSKCEAPKAESLCSDGIDNDCDGKADEADGDCGASVCVIGASRDCTTACGSSSVQRCDGSGKWEKCAAAATESNCGNAEDDDCDGKIDKSDADCWACTAGQSKACVSSCGSTGTARCEASKEWGDCRPPSAESDCGNKLDDDCDGKVDQADQDCWACSPATKKGCLTSCGSTGTATCEGSGQWSACVAPASETGNCGDNVDNDCDGAIDLKDQDCWSCTPGQTKPCSTSCGATGMASCEGSGQWGSCIGPTDEKSACKDGVDNDCDGKADLADNDCWVCTPGESKECKASCGSSGTVKCDGTGQWGSCVAPSHEMGKCSDGIDNDCDGKIDKGDNDCWECTPSDTRTCTPCGGVSGSQTCSATGNWGGCKAPSSKEGKCNDGVDNDCDGRTDTQDGDCPIVKCEDSEGGNCNTDMGYGDHCKSSDNRGCSAAKFWAWCNRRNNRYPGIWDKFLRDWVDARCDGKVVLVDKGSPDYFMCTSSNGTTYICYTPLVLSFDADAPVTFSSAEHAFSFAPGLTGFRGDWPTDATPWLALDRNGNGAIDDGSELFGTATPVVYGRRAVNGFDALADLDEDRDGVISPADRAWPRLLLWRDGNSDGRSTAEELLPVAAAGLQAIELSYQTSRRCDERGNCELERARFFWRDAAGRLHTGAVVDVHLPLQAGVCQ